MEAQAEVGRQPALTGAEVERFRTQGFLGPFTAFAPDEMAAMRKTVCERVLPTPTPHDSYGRVRHLDSHTVWRLCSARAVVSRMAALWGPDLMLWHSAFFDKQPATADRPDEYHWHQDAPFWSLEPMLSLSAWLALTPATLDNGCVEVIPGAHKRIIPAILTGDVGHARRFAGRAADPAYVDDRGKVSLVLEPGQFFLFNERTLHRSGPNRTRERRIGISIRVTLPLVKSYHRWPCVLLCGRDRFGCNAFVDPPTAEPDIARWPLGLPDAGGFGFDRPVPGLGWHQIERADGRSFCWTGPENDSWIDLRLSSRGDHTLQCHVLTALHPRLWRGARLSVNGIFLAVRWRPSGVGAEAEAHVPGHALGSTSDRVRIGVHVEETIRPCDVNPASPDGRSLGLAVHRIALTPLG